MTILIKILKSEQLHLSHDLNNEVSMTFEKNIFKAKALHCKNATLI